MAQGSAESQDFIICPGFTCMNWLPSLGRCNKKKRVGWVFYRASPMAQIRCCGSRWLKARRWGSQDFIICPGFTCMNWLPALGRCNKKKKVGWVFYRASPMAQIGCCGSRWLKARRWGSQDFIISVGEGCQILSSLGGRRGTCVTGSSFSRSVFETWSDFGWDRMDGWDGMDGRAGLVHASQR